MTVFKDTYKNKKVLITGATGFKGTWLSIWLRTLGAQVIGYSLWPNTTPSMFDICHMKDKITSIIGDVRDYESIEKVCREYEPNIIFHLAAQPLVRLSYKEPLKTYETNVMGTANILEAAKNCNSVEAVIVITTDKCYENKEWVYGYRENDPMGGYDPYSSSKGCVELIVSSYRNSFYNDRSIPLASVRAGNVIGGGDWAEDRLIPDFVRAVSQNNDIIVRNPLATRPWQHVLEPLSGYLWLGALMVKDKEKYNSGWNFGPRDSDILNVEDILRLCTSSWGKGEMKFHEGYNPHEANSLKLDISKANTYLKWKPVKDVKTAVYDTIEWYKTYYETNKNMYDYTIKQIHEYEDKGKELGLIWSE